MTEATSEWVALNVGGTRFHTTRTTLTSVPGSMLARMFEPGSHFTHHRDGDGAVLIDRDGRYFAPLLNFLRHGAIVVDPGLSSLGVYQEAKFFGLEAVAAALEPERRPPLLSLESASKHSAGLAIKSLLALANGTVLSGATNGAIGVHHPAPLEDNEHRLGFVCIYAGHGGPVNALLYVPELERLLSVSDDSTVKVWGAPPPVPNPPVPAPTLLASKSCAASLRFHGAPVSCLVSHAGWFVSGSHDKSLAFFTWGSVADVRPEARVRADAHDAPILAIGCLGAALVSADANGTMHSWSLETATRLATLATASSRRVLAMLPTQQGAAGPAGLYAGDASGMVRLWTTGAYGAGGGEPCEHVRQAPDERASVSAAWQAAVLQRGPNISGDEDADEEEDNLTLQEMLAAEPLSAAALAAAAREVRAMAEVRAHLVTATGHCVCVVDTPAAGRGGAHRQPRRTTGFRSTVCALAATDAAVYVGCADGTIHTLGWVEASCEDDEAEAVVVD